MTFTFSIVAASVLLHSQEDISLLSQRRPFTFSVAAVSVLAFDKGQNSFSGYVER